MTRIDKKNFNVRRCIFAIISSFLMILVIMQIPQNSWAEEPSSFNRNLRNYNSKLQIVGSGEKKVAEFFVAIAGDAEKKSYGLMNLEHLPQKYGMLFLFERDQVISMWMKNTLIPLDMIFIDKNEIIVGIASNTSPLSEEFISSKVPAQKVLEINGGLAKKLGVKIGQKMKVEIRKFQ